MAAGSIPRIRNAVATNLTLTGATVTTTGLATNSASYIAYAVVFTSLAGGATVAINLQECDTVGGTYTNVTGAAIAAITSASDGDTAVICVKNVGRKAFTRLSIVTSGGAVVAKNICCVTTGLPFETTNAAGTAVSGTTVVYA